MRRALALAPAAVLALMLVLPADFALEAQVPAAADVNALFARFLSAQAPQDVAAAIRAVTDSGVRVDTALRALKAGRAYSRDVPRGVVQDRYQSDSGEYFYTLDVPETYDPARQYQVRVQLHGGVGRIETNVPPRPGVSGRLAGAEQIYVMPYAWREAPWWSARQVANLHAILDRVKRTYNVNENRVVLSGVSDGGSAAYYMALRDTTPYASVVPLNGFIMVLRNETMDADGDLFPHNLRNKPLFIVNGGRDPLYPAGTVEPYIEQMKKAGVDLVYRPQPNAGHDTSWWPDLKDSVEQFVTAHPRTPLPDTLTWESGSPNIPARAHWLIIDRLSDARQGEPSWSDANRMASRPALDFGIRSSGTQVNRVVAGSNAEQIGLKSGDVVLTLNNQPVPAGTELSELLRSFPAGRPLLLTVSRAGESRRLTGRYAPAPLPGDAEFMLPPQLPSGRVDLTRAGNTVAATTRGVAAFTLLLSPDQFDFSRPLIVTVNGRTAFEGMVRQDLGTLLKWAAADNDRTMLFTAEVHVAVAP